MSLKYFTCWRSHGQLLSQRSPFIKSMKRLALGVTQSSFQGMSKFKHRSGKISTRASTPVSRKGGSGVQEEGHGTGTSFLTPSVYRKYLVPTQNASGPVLEGGYRDKVGPSENLWLQGQGAQESQSYRKGVVLYSAIHNPVLPSIALATVAEIAETCAFCCDSSGDSRSVHLAGTLTTF